MSATEHHLNFEREPAVEAQKPLWRDVSVSISRNLWSMHAMSHRVLEVLGLVGGRVRSMAERGPDPGYAESDFERGMRAGARYGGYHESHKQGGSSWTKAILTIACGVALAGILGGVAMYGKLAAVEANQISQQKQLDSLTQMVLNLTRRAQ
jgi:hypothetical protein